MYTHTYAYTSHWKFWSHTKRFYARILYGVLTSRIKKDIFTPGCFAHEEQRKRIDSSRIMCTYNVHVSVCVQSMKERHTFIHYNPLQGIKGPCTFAIIPYNSLQGSKRDARICVCIPSKSLQGSKRDVRICVRIPFTPLQGLRWEFTKNYLKKKKYLFYRIF